MVWAHRGSRMPLRWHYSYTRSGLSCTSCRSGGRGLVLYYVEGQAAVWLLNGEPKTTYFDEETTSVRDVLGLWTLHS